MAKKKKKQKTKKKILKPVKTKRIKVNRKVKLKKTVRIKKKAKVSKTVPDNTIHRTKIRVIGIGGGAGSIISEIISKIKKANFVVANTDSRALKAVRKARRFHFGQNLTKGLGTGMNAGVGEMAAQAEKEKIKQLFEGQDLCIIVACLGGGTSSGATPIFAKLSKSSGCLTYGIFTLPFEFEGEKKMEIAKESLLKIRPDLRAFSIIPNERIFQIIDKNTPLKNALSAINKRLAENLEGVIEMIYLPGLINIDFADLKTILAGRGRLAYLNTIEIEDINKEEVSKKIISSSLYPYTIKGAKGILYNVVGGKNLQLSEVSQISKIISDSASKNAKIIFGINQGQKYQNKIKITLLATGCGTKNVLLKPIKRTEHLTLRIKKSKVKRAKAKKPKVVKTKIISQKTKKPKLIKKKSKPKPKLHPPKFSKKILAGKPKPQPKPKIEKPKPKTKPLPRSEPSKPVEVRRNALQLKKVVEQEEKEILAQEKIWETPAILRKKE